VVAGHEFGIALGLTREATYRVIEALSREGAVLYAGAGPRIALIHRGKGLVDGEVATVVSLRT